VVHVSVLVLVPLLVAVVTALSNALGSLSFLLFPPLASGTYTLFVDPEGKYASPVQFVAGLTVGALCGWGALAATRAVGLTADPGSVTVTVFGAAFAVFSVGAATWMLEIEEPAAYATALLGLLVEPGQSAAFTASVFLASSIVAVVFYVWHERIYERRAEILYESTNGDDHVLVPMRGENPDATAMLAARLAGAHDAGKVVLLDLVDNDEMAERERDLLADRRPRRATDGGRNGADDHGTDDGDADDPVAAAASHLERRAAEIETRVGVPCEVVVAVAGRSPGRTVRQTATAVNCDLVAAPYEERYGALSPFVRSLFDGRVDVVVHRSRAGRTRWKRILVTVRRASDVAHSMLDFATRLAGRSGHVDVATCVTSNRERRRAEETLADLVEPFDGEFETRVSTQSVETFLAENAAVADLVVMGASRDRSAASRLVSPPTFERIQDLDADVVVVDRN